MWSTIFIVVLIFLLIGLGVALWYINVKKLEPLNEDNKIYMFGGDPNVTNGQVALQCPAGRSIRVLDAWYETYDPNYQFAPATDCMGLYGTDDSGNIVGPVDSSGNIGSLGSMWEVISDAKYMTKNNGYAVASTVCGYDAVEGTTTNGSGQCLIINALPVVAAVANGQNSSSLSINSDSALLPSPCIGTISGQTGTLDIHDSTNGNYNSLQKFLPLGSPTLSDVNDNTSSTAGQQGYYLHGTYTCALD